MKKIGLGCFTVLIGTHLLVGVGMIGNGAWLAWRSVQAASWPTAPGKITKLDLQKASDQDSESYEVKVRYAYSVDGTAYEGERLAFGYSGSNSRTAEEAIHARLRNAKNIDVRYDPSNHSTSCLSFGWHRSVSTTLASGAPFLLIPIALMLACRYILFTQRDSVLLDNLSVE